MKAYGWLVVGVCWMIVTTASASQDNCNPHWPNQRTLSGIGSRFVAKLGCKGRLLLIPRSGARKRRISVRTRPERIKEQNRLMRLRGKTQRRKLKVLLPGLRSVGVSLCCPSGGKVNLCLSLEGRPRKLSPAKIAKALSTVYPNARCLPVVVSRLHRPKPVPKPRCHADDFRCLPVAYSKNMKLRYKRKGRRVPVSFPRTSSGRCRHDGECRVAGCGNHCVAYTTPSFAAICPWYGTLKAAYCGCVKRRCTWFTQ
jgi:hypothetical protein